MRTVDGDDVCDRCGHVECECDEYSNSVFIGPCQCQHDKDEHGWYGCDQCDCDAYWEAD